MSKPKPRDAVFTFGHDGKAVIVTFLFDKAGRHLSIMVNRAGNAIRIDNRLGAYKARVTDAARLIEQTANGASPVYRGRRRASRAAKPDGVDNALKRAFKVFGLDP